MRSARMKLTISTALAIALTACGGGGGGGSTGLASTPSPPTQPPPPTAEPPFDVTADTMFVTVGEDVEFRWDDSSKAYEIKLPGGTFDRLSLDQATSTYENHRAPSGYYISVSKNLPYQYTNLAHHLESQLGRVVGIFAYGIPTAAGNAPTAGSASYSASLYGMPGARSGQGGYEMDGDAKLTFNFGAGTLTGYMHPIISDAWFEYDLGRYDFTQTVYSIGSTTFSGKFIVPGGGSTADSAFSGSFTGPNAAELMAQWHAPFRDPNSNQWSIISGLWIGKKD